MNEGAADRRGTPAAPVPSRHSPRAARINAASRPLVRGGSFNVRRPGALPPWDDGEVTVWRACPLIAAGAVALLAAGCGGGRRAEPPEAGQDPAARVIGGWADDVRRGRYPSANRRFAVPATLANRTPPLVLRTRSQIDAFNRSLTCGAVLLSTRRLGDGRVLATFRLTEGSGPEPSCGTGIGHRAQVAFRLRSGHIVEWLRVVARPPASASPPV